MINKPYRILIVDDESNMLKQLTIWGSDQKQEMILNVLCLFSVNYRFS